jgi:hypothetical protein
MRCEMVSVLLERYKAFIPEALYRCDPAQLVDDFVSIIVSCIHSDQMLQRLLIHDEPQSIAEICRSEIPL